MNIKLGLLFLSVFLLPGVTGWAAESKSALITADHMEFDKKKGATLLKGKVKVIVASRNTSLKAERLKIVRDSVSREILRAELDQDISIKAPDRSIVGDHMLYDRDQAIIELKGNLEIKLKDYTLLAENVIYHLKEERGILTAKRGERVHLRAQRRENKKSKMALIEAQAEQIRVQKKSGRLVLLNKVEIKDVLKNITFKTDRASLYFNANEEVEEIIAEGNFLLNQPDRFSSADRGYFDYTTGKILLSGNVVVQDRDAVELRSSTVEMFLDVTKGFISGAEQKPLQLKIPLPQ